MNRIGTANVEVTSSSQSRSSTSSVSLEAEFQLILACSRLRLGGRADEVRRLTRGVHWQSAVDLARRHGLLPVVYTALAEVAMESVPEATLVQMRHEYLLNAVSSRLLGLRLLELAALLESEGIRMAPFKGPALAETVYGGLALRPSADLDLFVAAEDKSVAIERLLAHGYSTANEVGVKPLHPRNRYHARLVAPDGLLVELHWDSAPTFFAPGSKGEGWLQRSTRTPILDRPLFMFSTEDHLLLLAIHGSKHRWERLLWVLDIASIITTAEAIDWKAIYRRAQRMGIVRMLHLGVGLAAELFGAELPERTGLDIARDPVVKALSADVRARLVHDGRSRSDGPARGLTLPRFYWRLQTRPAHKARYLMHLLQGKLPGH